MQAIIIFSVPLSIPTDPPNRRDTGVGYITISFTITHRTIPQFTKGLYQHNVSSPSALRLLLINCQPVMSMHCLGIHGRQSGFKTGSAVCPGLKTGGAVYVL